MSARALLPATIHRTARKTSSAGKPYLIVTVREGSGAGARWWTVFAFREPLIEELERLSAGDAVAFSGTFEAKIYAPAGGEARVSLSMNADAIVSTRTPKKKADDKPDRKPAARHAGIGDPDDAIPF